MHLFSLQIFREKFLKHFNKHKIARSKNIAKEKNGNRKAFNLNHIYLSTHF